MALLSAFTKRHVIEIVFTRTIQQTHLLAGIK